MALDKTFAIYTGLLQKKYTRSAEGLEQHDIRSKDVNDLVSIVFHFI